VPTDGEGGSAPDPLSWLLDVSHTLPPAELSDAVAVAFARLGARSSCMFLADHDQMSLHPLVPQPGNERSFAVDGTVGGRAYTFETAVTVPDDGGGVRVWVPLVNGTARLGVVSVDLDAPGAVEDAALERLAALAAELVMTKNQYTDIIELTRRQQRMSLEAELQRATLPPVALITPCVSVAGLLLPAYDVAGDSFDYALNRHDVEVSVIDSVGHELMSSLISHLVSGSLRNSRRAGLGLADAYAAADAAVAGVFPDLRFATAAFGRLDLRSGCFRWVSAGHPPPVVVRDGRVVGEAETRPVLPIGLGGVDPPVNEVVLGPGDKLLLYTDGAVESGVRGGERFGLDRLVDLLGQNLLDAVPPAELLRRLVTAVLEHSAHDLHDDTTLVLVEYHGPPAG
jgi:serine phosphatase RsbU (regulator of sigma subunit)